jgi:hypothetical protein
MNTPLAVAVLPDTAAGVEDPKHPTPPMHPIAVPEKVAGTELPYPKELSPAMHI